MFAGDAQAIGERRPISLHDRMLAGEWLAARGWGRAPVIVELPDAPAGSFTPEQAAELRKMPQELRDGIRRWLLERRETYLSREREAAERRTLAFMLPSLPNENGDEQG